MNVVLIGFSGTGKSSVGRILARRLGWEFVDTDAEVERAAGRRIHEIFAREGEAAFRRLEAEAVRRALGRRHRVVALGGGAVVDPAGRKLAREGNLVVLLDGQVETLFGRLAAAVAEEPRPLLESPDPRARIRELKTAREPIYREAAHLVMSTDGIDAEEVARRVEAVVRERHPN